MFIEASGALPQNAACPTLAQGQAYHPTVSSEPPKRSGMPL